MKTKFRCNDASCLAEGNSECLGKGNSGNLRKGVRLTVSDGDCLREGFG